MGTGDEELWHSGRCNQERRSRGDFIRYYTYRAKLECQRWQHLSQDGSRKSKREREGKEGAHHQVRKPDCFFKLRQNRKALKGMAVGHQRAAVARAQRETCGALIGKH